MGKASRKKKVSIDEALNNQGRGHGKELAPSQESPSNDNLQKTTSIVTFIPILIIVLVSFAVYFNAFFGDFVYDDKFQILDNPWISNIRNIATIFSKSVWSFASGIVTSNYYRPLMHIVYMLNYHVFGLKAWGFHLVNVLFHCGAVLVFLIIRRFLTEPRVTTSSVYLSPPFIAAMLFASHPIHTEAVTWISGLPDVAFTFFYLLSFYLYVRSNVVLSSRYLFSLMCFAVAAFFKEPALTLPDCYELLSSQASAFKFIAFIPEKLDKDANSYFIHYLLANAGHEGRGATTLKLKKNDGYSRVPLDAFVVWPPLFYYELKSRITELPSNLQFKYFSCLNIAAMKEACRGVRD